MVNVFDEHDLSGSIGEHLVYIYDNSWSYEIYVKSGHALDYRIHSDIVSDRWVRDQKVYVTRVGESIYRISWIEPTGTGVSLIVNLDDRPFYGAIFFPCWTMNNPERTTCFQSDHIPLMDLYRDAGPTYPTEVIDEFATITSTHDYGADNDEVINCPVSEPLADFPTNL